MAVAPTFRTVARAIHTLSQQICAIHERSRGTYGMPRVWAELRYEGIYCSRKRVARLLRLAGLQGCHRRKGPRTTRRKPETAPAPDLVKRDFTAAAPDQLWVADITYVSTWMGFLYLAIVLDIYSRRIVGWAMADHLRSELVIEAVEMALWRRQRPAWVSSITPIRVRQYTSLAFGQPAARGGDDSLDGEPGRLFRQRDGGELLRHPRMRTARAGNASRPAMPPASPSSTTSRGSTTPTGGTPPSTTCHPQHTRGDGQSKSVSRSLSLSTQPG